MQLRQNLLPITIVQDNYLANN